MTANTPSPARTFLRDLSACLVGGASWLAICAILCVMCVMLPVYWIARAVSLVLANALDVLAGLGLWIEERGM